MLYEHVTINENGILEFSGKSAVDLVKRYGTPLYVMDERLIRERIRTYQHSLKRSFNQDAAMLYASKACDFKAMYRIAQEEGCGVDVVSQGEIFTAHAAGFPMEKAYFHGNNKTDEEIRYAMEMKVGTFIVDGEEELDVIEQTASQMNLIQNIMIRITPGIDPHTYAAVATGLVDSKFGSAVVTGAAEHLVVKALSYPHVKLTGFHCHVGSQVFDEDVFIKCSDVMLNFISQMKQKHGYAAKELNLGGGYGVRYLESDPLMDIEQSIHLVGKHVKELCEKLHLDLPAIRMEPGRSIVADAGCTLYRVGSVKRIPGIKNYVSVDGGMTDNPRFALYHSSYTVLCANRMHDQKTMKCSVVGKCCESGDILQENVMLPETIQRNDVIAVLTTGAYNYSMASNYNRICRPAVVMIDGEDEKIVVRRESLEDLIKNEM